MGQSVLEVQKSKYISSHQP